MPEMIATTPAYFAGMASRFWTIRGTVCLPVSRSGRVKLPNGKTLRAADVAPAAFLSDALHVFEVATGARTQWASIRLE